MCVCERERERGSVCVCERGECVSAGGCESVCERARECVRERE